MKLGRIGFAVALSASATVFAPFAARAQACGGGAFQTCASVNITKTDLGSGVTEIVMTVTNLSGMNGTFAGTIFGTMGLWGLSNYTYVANSLQIVSGPGLWAWGTPGLSGAGIQPQVAGVNNSGSIQNGLKTGETLTFKFRISGPSFASIDVSDWAIHGKSGPAGCSTKLVSTDGTVNQGPYDPTCSTNVVPEPATLLLLGTGLMGMAGGAVARRRRTTT